MRNIWLIARREYLEQVRSKVFRWSTILLPIVMGGMATFFDRLNHAGQGAMRGATHAGHVGNSGIGPAYMMAMLLSITGTVYGLNVGRSIIAEKTSRIFEVLLASVRPEDLMFGKLIGVGSVGLTQLAVWLVMGGVFLSSNYAKQIFQGNVMPQLSAEQIILFVIFFLLGYLFYSAISAGMAATVSTEQELQQMMPLNAIPVWISFGIIPYVAMHPNSNLSVALSFIPPVSPIAILLRQGFVAVPTWEIVLSIAVMAGTIWGMIWFASRLYRVGILMYGKRATLPEILRWIRYS